MKLKRSFISGLLVCMMVMTLSIAVMAASESLNNGGATWYGGEDANNILYSKVWDNKVDKLAHKVTVWVEDDKGGRSEKTGTTTAVGEAGEVKVTRGATHTWPFIPEECGYKDYSVVAVD